MENDKDKGTLGKKVINTIITVVGVMVYIVYKLAMRFIEFIKRFKKSGTWSVIFIIIGLVAAIVFWPITLAFSGVLVVLAFVTYGVLWE